MLILLARAWKPLIILLAIPGHLSRRQAAKLVPKMDQRYHLRKLMVSHQEVGGVTATTWRVIHITRDEALKTFDRTRLMTIPSYRRNLQTVLDDTVRGVKGVAFEAKSSGDDLALGVVKHRIDGGYLKSPVYNGAGTAPDVSALPDQQRFIWVRAQSVWGTEAVFRQVTDYELLALWDYEGKLESKRWSQEEMALVINSRFRSPPAKILRAVVVPAFEFLMSKFFIPPLGGGSPGDGKEKQPLMGGTTPTVAFSPLERKEETGRAAATADHAVVDLSVWAQPGETPRQAAAREVLRKLAVRYWAHMIERDAQRWLNEHPTHTERDEAGLDDCIWRAKACSYWEWHRGSRVMWFRLPSEWQPLFRDGPKYFHFGPFPKGFTHNNPSESRQAELEVRKKIFKLNFRRYTEPGLVDLVQGRFSVVKAMEGGEVLDIRVVWNSKSNGYNDQIWAPGFCLPTWADTEDMSNGFRPVGPLFGRKVSGAEIHHPPGAQPLFRARRH